MLERRRKARFGSLSEGGDDVELGLAPGHREDDGLGAQESGVMDLEQEVDNWDENAVDNWDTEDGDDPSILTGTTAMEREDQKTPGGKIEGGKRSD
jgi:hypothetical protein